MKKRHKRDISTASSKFSFAIGAYVRVSTEEQAAVVEGSLDNQKHRIKAFVDSKNVQEENWGEIVEYYIDDGYSAKDTNRPAYQRMLRDLKKGKIRMILVTELSRLSRSIPDFCDLLEDLEEYRGKFLSIKELFDTSTPAGEMMIYNMINLAQFERKQISERVSINAHARAIRGLNSGAPTILGYDKKEDNKATFVVNEREAQQVREIFELFIEHRSLARTITHLEAKGIVPKARLRNHNRLVKSGRWSQSSLKFVLHNLAYIGMKEVNKNRKNEEQHLLKPWQRYSVVKASWPALVDEKVFKQAQLILEENRESERRRLDAAEERTFVLSGIARCGECGRAFVGHSAHGKHQVHRYYAHSYKQGDVINCTVKRTRADELEDHIINYLSEIPKRAGHFNKIADRIRQLTLVNPKELKSKISEVRRQLNQTEKEIAQVFRMQTDSNQQAEGLKLVADQLNSLGQRKRALLEEQEKLSAFENHEEDMENALKDLSDRMKAFSRGYAKASIGMKLGLLKSLLRDIVILPDSLKINYFVQVNELSNVTGSHEQGGPKTVATVTDLSGYRMEKQYKEVGVKKETGTSPICGLGKLVGDAGLEPTTSTL